MDSRATGRGLPVAVFFGGLVALTWAALTVLTGGGVAVADEEPGSPLSGLTSLVDSTATTLTAPVESVISDVVAPVASAVATDVLPTDAVAATSTQPVSDPSVVDPTVAPVAETAADAVNAVTTPLTASLEDSPVSQIATPIVDAVTALPVVGEVIDDIGVDDLAGDLAGVVDDAAGHLGGVVEDAVLPSIRPPGTPLAAPESPLRGSESPDPPITPVPGASEGVPAVTPVAADISTPSAFVDSASSASGAGAVSPRDLGAAQHAGDPALAPPGAPPSTSSVAGAGAGSSSAYARLSGADGQPVRAWERGTGASDDALPSSPVADTVASPD